MDRRKLTGQLGETVAAAFLQEQGVVILRRNYRCRFGEIDLIGRDGHTLVIIEVKARKKGAGAQAVDLRKQKRICATLTWFRMKERIPEYVPVRFDVIEVDGAMKCRWIRNAFEYQELT
ncbi:MAG: YraN family protein [Eubacterium sp.]|nr:YraN family protein [Eubacterium sp.]